LTLVALSPAPTAASSTAGQANCSASASGFGAVMTDAKAALVSVDASVDATAAVLQGIAAPATPAGSPDSAVKGAAKDPADPAASSATDRPVPDALSPIALPIALPIPLPAVVPTLVPTVAPSLSLQPTAGPRTDASSDAPAAPSAAPTPSSVVTPSAPATSVGVTSAPVTDAAAPLSIAMPAMATPPVRLEAVAASTPTAAPTPAQSTPFAAQLARPIFTLATAAPGSHTLTISVTPDTLGPVTVRAHVSPDGIRIELFAPTDLGRDAIRAILPDLRKDLAGAGVGANLDLSPQNQPSDAGDRRGDTGSRPGRAYIVPAAIVADGDVAAASTRILTTSSIDVLA
jgi:flagellar hook-length control protein FliK